MSNQVAHFEVIGTDAKRLQGFYASLFGWHVDASNPMSYGLVSADEGGIGGGIAGGQPPRVTFYVAVEDLDKTLAKAEQLGGKTMMPPMDVPNGPRIALFADPDGNVIGLMRDDR